MDRTEKLLKELVEAFGPPGFEDEVREIVKREFQRADEVLTDRLGSVIAVKRGSSERPRILFAGHMDEVGLIVKGFTKEGFVKVEALGGWTTDQLIGQRVRVRTQKGDFYGVIGTLPPHLRRSEEERRKLPELKELFVDFGVDKDFDVRKELGIRIGDPIVPVGDFLITGNPEVYMAKAFDDREGVARLVRILDEIENQSHPNTVYLAAVVQEEVGLRGAGTSAWVVEPDVAIALDVSLAEDVPGLESYTDARFGGGVTIVVTDRTMVAHRRFRDFLVSVAEEENIPYHLATVMGGYDTGRIHLLREGVPSAVLGVPSRYIHGFNSMIHRDDFDAAVKLAVALIQRLDEKTLQDFLAY